MPLRYASMVAVLLASLAAAAQTPNTLQPFPIKMGLWQSTVTAESASGVTQPVGLATSHLTCYTAESWKESIGALHQETHKQQMTCTTSNIQQDSHHISFDSHCSQGQVRIPPEGIDSPSREVPGVTINSHAETFFDSDTVMHGSVTSTTYDSSAPPGGRRLTANTSSKFISADCGNLKPGQSRSVHP